MTLLRERKANNRGRLALSETKLIWFSNVSKGEFIVTQERIEQLFAAVSDADSVLILPHNDPDPDAIASAVALRYLLEEKLRVDAQIAYRGFIGRAENKALDSIYDAITIII